MNKIEGETLKQETTCQDQVSLDRTELVYIDLVIFVLLRRCRLCKNETFFILLAFNFWKQIPSILLHFILHWIFSLGCCWLPSIPNVPSRCFGGLSYKSCLRDSILIPWLETTGLRLPHKHDDLSS